MSFGVGSCWLAVRSRSTSLGGEGVIPDEGSHVACLWETVLTDSWVLAVEVTTSGEGGTFLIKSCEEVVFISDGKFVTSTVGDDGIIALNSGVGVDEWIGWNDDGGVVVAEVWIGGRLAEVSWASRSWWSGLVDWLAELVTTFSELTDNELFVDWGVGESFEVGETATDEVGVGPVEEGECTISILSASGVGVVVDEGNWCRGITNAPGVESLIPVSFSVGMAASGDENELLNNVSSVFTSSGVW